MKPELEIEIKVLEIDQEKLEHTLQKVRAVKKYRTIMMIASYDFYDVPYLEEAPKNIRGVILAAYEFYKKHGSLKENNAHLRLRTFTHTDKIEFTFKHNLTEPQKDALKKAHEYNTYLSPSERDYLKRHLEKLGIEENAIHEKYRTSWQVPNGCICDIDTYPGIPTFVELEGSKKQIEEAIKLLELTDHHTTQDSGAHFFAKYNQQFYSRLLF